MAARTTTKAPAAAARRPAARKAAPAPAAPDNGDAMATLLAALGITAEQVAALTQPAGTGVTAVADTPAPTATVKLNVPAQPELTDPDAPASVKVRRFYADLLVGKAKAEGRKPTAAQTAAAAAYVKALNGLLGSLGVEADTLDAQSAQDAVAILVAEQKARKAASRRK